MTVEYKEYPEQKMVEIRVDGKVTRADYDELVPSMEAFMVDHDKVKILEAVTHFKGFEPSMLTDGIKFDIKNLEHYSHCAVVSDSRWIGPFARVLPPLLSLELRTFKLAEQQQAREWLKSA